MSTLQSACLWQSSEDVYAAKRLPMAELCSRSCYAYRCYDPASHCRASQRGRDGEHAKGLLADHLRGIASLFSCHMCEYKHVTCIIWAGWAEVHAPPGPPRSPCSHIPGLAVKLRALRLLGRCAHSRFWFDVFVSTCQKGKERKGYIQPEGCQKRAFGRSAPAHCQDPGAQAPWLMCTMTCFVWLVCACQRMAFKRVQSA
eukprot:1152232-Pelagomonas_calceolata.AAC.1